ncbi:nucleotide exchange factor GrpE [Lentilactobacillus sp. Marseille-Q4993]|uniref:nucleotide exchange factor GrpE n=1 Tax=Lentilactobacillus sp. Marseille-Q4993 TaxID=3039492 RepID=UPI0024BC30F9|nr:nucleotide exchange factor GrpE [Lentilactobacillus sp. Marseille-Q4993]
MADEEKKSSEQPQSENEKATDAEEKDTSEDSTKEVKAKKVDKADKQISELKQKLDDMENKYLRAEAEIKNIQAHAKKEQADLIKYDGQQIAHDILPIVDNLQRALEVEVSDEAGKQLKTGVQMVFEHLQKALSDNGVEKIDVIDKPFDPKFSQAIQTVDADDDHPAETVVKVLQDGYHLKDRVLRPAMVVVTK